MTAQIKISEEIQAWVNFIDHIGHPTKNREWVDHPTKKIGWYVYRDQCLQDYSAYLYYTGSCTYLNFESEEGKIAFLLMFS